MTQTPAITPEVQQEIQQQAGKILSQVAGYVGLRTIDIGLQHGLLAALADAPLGMTAEALAEETGLDPFYTAVWCRSAYAAEVLEVGEFDAYRLAPHLDKILLDKDFPGYVGGIPGVMVQPEFFDRFAENLPSGKRLWWNDCSPEFIESVSSTARPFYTRLIPGGFSKVPGLPETLAGEVRIMDLACGAGVGLLRMAQTYPQSTLVGVDGDAYSLGQTQERINEAGLQDRISLIHSTFEDLNVTEQFDIVTINVSMHECRDIDKVTQNVYRALKPDSHFVISDFPFPGTTEGLRTVPARVMNGIQFFEALIDDQLLPTQAYVDLLAKHGFREVGYNDVTPVHAVTYGRK